MRNQRHGHAMRRHVIPDGRDAGAWLHDTVETAIRRSQMPEYLTLHHPVFDRPAKHEHNVLCGRCGVDITLRAWLTNEPCPGSANGGAR